MCIRDRYLSSRDTDELFVLNASTMQIITKIRVGDEPFGVVVNPATNKVYVNNYVDGTVSIINGATNTVIATVAVGPETTFVDVNQTTNRIYSVSLVSYTHLRAHETVLDLVCRLLLEKKTPH